MSTGVWSRGLSAFALCAALSFAVQALVITRSRHNDAWIDLKIYMEVGSMQTAGLDPYDFDQQPALREARRLDADNYDPWSCGSQERWNYYVSSNLPASTLLYAAIDRIAPTPLGYRFAFAALDAITAGLVALTVLRHWRVSDARLQLAIVLGLGPLNPLLLKQGAYLPEDKGAQVGLMLAAYLALRSSKHALSFHGSALLLGAAIAYKLFGVFLLPFAVVHVATRGGASAWSTGRAVTYVALVVAWTAAWFAPYPSALGPLLERFATSGGLARGPIHASPWLPFHTSFGPSVATTLRVLGASCLLGLAAAALRSRPMRVSTACMDALMAYGGAWLISGALNRFNIVFLVTICLLGAHDTRMGLRLAACYLLYAPVVVATFVNLWTNSVLVHSQYGPTHDLGHVVDNYFTLAFVVWYVTLRVLTVRGVANGGAPPATGHPAAVVGSSSLPPPAG